ncbi:ion transporter [Gangjinia marincola]|uniref:Ion transporter n=1 Tax=Gangjinia marincola TaxID=578463 RepID=A0ABN1MF21_9FLAO
MHDIIYEADTPMGKLFDVILLILILVSIVIVMLESIPKLNEKYADTFYLLEWIITGLFTIEYIARIISIKKPTKYIFSFYGIIDLLSVLPLYLSFFIAGSSALLTVRSLRLLRIFRILKVSRYLGAGNYLKKAISDSREKIAVFLFAVLMMCIISGTLMYIIEGEESGFVSIPVGIYWSIVTLTTVGFGDIAPVTPLGQFIAAVIMIMGYGIIAVPTGIVTSEYSKNLNSKENKVILNTIACYNCNAKKHQDDAKFCHNCGEPLRDD